MPRRPDVARSSETLSENVFGDLLSYARAKGDRVFPLHVGDTYREPPDVVRTANRLDLPDQYTYGPTQGEPELLAAIVAREARRGRTLDPACIQVMLGATAGLSVLASTLLDPGDEVIVPAPYWPLIRGIVASRGATPVEVPFFDRLSEARFDPEQAIAEAITPRTVALYLNSPNNPTGRVLSADVIRALVRLAERHDLWLICDEAYEDLHFDPDPVAPTWTHAQGRALVSHTVSKSYGLAGARIGWMHGPEAVMRSVRDVQTFQTYCAPRILQHAVARVLTDGDGWLEEARLVYRRAAEATACALGVTTPEAGTFLFFDASPFRLVGEADAMGFLRRAVDRGVLLTPGRSCGDHYAGWARLCFTSVPPDALDEALVRLAPLVSRD